MTQQNFPDSHTTTTTVTHTTTPATIYLDLSYIRTTEGILKCIQIVLNLVGFICITSTILRLHSRGEFFNTIAMGGFWFTGIMLVLYIFHVTEKLRAIPWLKIELVFCGLWTFFYLVAASCAADFGFNEAFAAAAFFGFCAMIAYGYDAFLKYTQIRAGVVTVTVKTTNSPTEP